MGYGDIADLKCVTEAIDKYEKVRTQVMNHPAWMVMMEAVDNEIISHQPIAPPDIEYKAGFVAGLMKIKSFAQKIESNLKMLYDEKESIEELLKESK